MRKHALFRACFFWLYHSGLLTSQTPLILRRGVIDDARIPSTWSTYRSL